MPRARDIATGGVEYASVNHTLVEASSSATSSR
jgi:hypothetical protein